MAGQELLSAIDPWGGIFFAAANKRFSECVLVVPFYGAKRAQLKRHIEFINSQGFDVIQVELRKDPVFLERSLISASGKIGIKHIWADQIEGLLNCLPGRKIVFAFSNPCGAAIEAIGRRQAVDIAGLICDSGPSGKLWTSMINFFTHEHPIKFLPAKLLTASLKTFMWTSDFANPVFEDLKKFPDQFRILSIRGWKDKLISAHDIDAAFEPHHHLDWRRLSLPQAGHLNGLRDFKEDYEGPVSDFLRAIGSEIAFQKYSEPR